MEGVVAWRTKLPGMWVIQNYSASVWSYTSTGGGGVKGSGRHGFSDVSYSGEVPFGNRGQ